MDNVKLEKMNIPCLCRFLLFIFLIGLAQWYFHAYLFFVILVLSVLFLVLSLFCSFFGLKKLTAKFSHHNVFLPRQIPNKVMLMIENRMAVPFLHVVLEFSEENLFLGEKRVFVRRSASPSKIWGRYRMKRGREENVYRKRQILLSPREKKKIPYTFRTEDVGSVRISLCAVRFTDYLGIVTWKRLENEQITMVCLPDNADEMAVETRLVDSMEQLSHEMEQRGSDDPELAEIREYLPGDKLNHIHWKLSNKCDRLMVKEFQREEGGRIYLALDLYNEKVDGENLINQTLGFAGQLVSAFLKEHYQVVVGWYSLINESFMSEMISDERQAEQMFTRLMYERVYTDKELFSRVLSEHKEYLMID